jgi:hypothetical protein
MKKLATAAVAVALATPALASEPFLYYSELNGSYQGSGWVKSNLLGNCHVVEDEGPQEECEIFTKAINVHDKPHGHVVGALDISVPIYVEKLRDKLQRHGDWTKVWTVCSGHLIPQNYMPNGVAIYGCEKKEGDQ